MIQIAVLFLATLFQQPAVDGNWLWKTIGADGADTPEAPLTLKTDGKKLTGAFDAGPDRKLIIENGEVDGNHLKFTVKRTRPDGSTMVYTMSAVVEGDAIKGEVSTDMDGNKVDSTWSARRPPAK